MRKRLMIFTYLSLAAMAMVLGGYWLWVVEGGRVPVQNTKALPPRDAMEPDALGGDDPLSETTPAPVIPEGFDFPPLMPSGTPIKIAPDNPATASQQAKAIATIPETDDAGVQAERQIFETLSLPAVSNRLNEYKLQTAKKLPNFFSSAPGSPISYRTYVAARYSSPLFPSHRLGWTNPLVTPLLRCNA